MEAVATTKNSRGSAQKARLVIDMIRGLSVNDALAILTHTNKRAAAPIKRTLDSAIANAVQQADKNNILVDVDDLTVKSCEANTGRTKHMRRVRPAPMGRAYRERRHFCHIKITVTNEKQQ
jgi:large subunit ribosomal protein L22